MAPPRARPISLYLTDICSPRCNIELKVWATPTCGWLRRFRGRPRRPSSSRELRPGGLVILNTTPERLRPWLRWRPDGHLLRRRQTSVPTFSRDVRLDRADRRILYPGDLEGKPHRSQQIVGRHHVANALARRHRCAHPRGEPSDRGYRSVARSCAEPAPHGRPRATRRWNGPDAHR